MSGSLLGNRHSSASFSSKATSCGKVSKMSVCRRRKKCVGEKEKMKHAQNIRSTVHRTGDLMRCTKAFQKLLKNCGSWPSRPSLRPMSHLLFYRATLSRKFIASLKSQVWHCVSCNSLAVTQLLFRIEYSILQYSILCNVVTRTSLSRETACSLLVHTKRYCVGFVIF